MHSPEWQIQFHGREVMGKCLALLLEMRLQLNWSKIIYLIVCVTYILWQIRAAVCDILPVCLSLQYCIYLALDNYIRHHLLSPHILSLLSLYKKTKATRKCKQVLLVCSQSLEWLFSLACSLHAYTKHYGFNDHNIFCNIKYFMSSECGSIPDTNKMVSWGILYIQLLSIADYTVWIKEADYNVLYIWMALPSIGITLSHALCRFMKL